MAATDIEHDEAISDEELERQALAAPVDAELADDAVA